MRYIVAGEIAGARGYFGGFGALSTNLARLMELPIVRNMEAASRFERARSSSWAILPVTGETFSLRRTSFLKLIAIDCADASVTNRSNTTIGGKLKTAAAPIIVPDAIDVQSALPVESTMIARPELRNVGVIIGEPGCFECAEGCKVQQLTQTERR